MSLGFGVMINMLAGNDNTIEAIRKSIGKEISGLKLENDTLTLTLLDTEHPQGFFNLGVWDGGQSCCESRWMHTDDDLPYYVGATLDNLEIADGPDENEGPYGECRESQFMKVRTSKGVFTVVNYVEHNGYYGGFSIWASIS